jgi:hypothetical protein
MLHRAVVPAPPRGESQAAIDRIPLSGTIAEPLAGALERLGMPLVDLEDGVELVR